ncbi:MAG TPA: hypothetical protein VFS10_23115 [Pyrinomonadaceae bacterium]|nr:hypothetical protein [Pyrinomonadaceae bacterium]
MGDPVLYQQVLDPKGVGTSLYETRVAGSVGWAGYVVMNTGVTLPPTISIPDSLNGTNTAKGLIQYNGAYVFASTRPPMVDTDPANFAAQVVAYVNASISQNRALFWLQDSKPTFGPFSAFGFQFGMNLNKQWVVNTNLNAKLGSNLNFNVNSSLILTADEANAQLVCSFRSSSVQLISLQSGNSFLGITPQPLSTQIPLAGPNTACFLFTGTMNPASTFTPALNGLAQGVRFVYNESNGQPQSLLYPAFNTAKWPSSVAFVATVDPSDPVNSVIAAADLQSGHIRTGLVLASTPSLASYYTTPQGNAISLVPLGSPVGATAPGLAAGALVMASASPASTALGQALIYLAPGGQFGVKGEGTAAGQPVSIMGGMFGSECLTLANYQAGSGNDTLCFLPSQPAFAPVFPFQTASLQSTGSGNLKPRLTADYLTPWATVLGGTAKDVVYQAEPEGSALYGVAAASAAASNGGPTVLSSMPPQMPLAGSTQHTFPLAPYANAPVKSVDPNKITSFESQIIAPTRKKVISDSATEVWTARAHARKNLKAVAGQQYTTSPQGFLVTSDPSSGAYFNVQLAQSQAPNSASFIPFAFTSPTEKLENALQSNQLFLVAVNPENLGPFQNQANVAGWNLAALVGQGVTATSYRNVMIFKFCSGSLADRVTNPNRWSSAEDFSLVAGTSQTGASVAYAGLSQWLQAYIADGIARAQSSNPSADFYKNFAQIATDPNWNGVIVLEADLSPYDLPPEIAGLAAGIDFTRFTAHHFGFTVSRVCADPKKTPPLWMDGLSSFFGLIDYEDPAYALNLANGIDPNIPIPVATSGDFQFTVLLLQVLFQNSKIAKFKSNIQLTVDALLGSKVTQTVGNALPGQVDGTPMPANGVVLDGSYVAQTGENSTAGSYVFQQTNTSVFKLDSNVLQAVAFNRTQFNTLGTDSGGVTSSRFLVWGAYDFTQLNDNQGNLFDVTSFGSPPDTSSLQLGAGLSFSNFVIGMSFNEATPNAQNFALTANNLAYDLNSSAPRPQSLFKGFGLQLKNFITVLDDKTPQSFGFLPVTSPLKLKMLTPPWFGVVYQVTMGGPGALASAAGFNSDLLLAWSPSTKAGDTQQAVFIGLSLPGANPGAKLFSLQGVFKVAVGAIALLRQPVPGNEGDEFYCLRLDDIGVKIFGIVKLPPDATIQFFLFGDPNSTGSLGWYAAYVADSTKAESGTTPLTPAEAVKYLPPSQGEKGATRRRAAKKQKAARKQKTASKKAAKQKTAKQKAAASRDTKKTVKPKAGAKAASKKAASKKAAKKSSAKKSSAKKSSAVRSPKGEKK